MISIVFLQKDMNLSALAVKFYLKLNIRLKNEVEFCLLYLNKNKVSLHGLK